MLDFPSTGLVAGVTTVTGPSGQEWLWDGVKWVAVGGGGGPSGPQTGDVRFDSGNLQRYDGTTWVNIPLGGGPSMGVTDASNAASGYVGELLFFDSGITVMTGQTSIALAQISLPAGDWDVSAYATFFGTTIAYTGNALVYLQSFGSQFTDYGTTKYATAPAVTWAGTATRCGVDLGTARLSINQATTVDLIGDTTFTPMPLAQQGIIRARRMR